MQIMYKSYLKNKNKHQKNPTLYFKVKYLRHCCTFLKTQLCKGLFKLVFYYIGL